MKKNKINLIFSIVAIFSIGMLISDYFISSANNSKRNVYASENSEEGYSNISEVLYSEDVVNDEKIEGYVENGVQIIEFDLQSNSYPSLEVKAGMPVRLIINVDENVLNGCNYVMSSTDMGFQKQLNIGENIIEFTPTETGQYIYSCYMGMIGAYINVVDETVTPNGIYGDNVSAGGCCGI